MMAGMAEDTHAEPVHLRVAASDFVGAGSWVYVWWSTDERGVVYVGATRLPPALRTWLHLHDADPNIGRVGALLPEARSARWDVLAFKVGAPESRAAVKAGLIDALARAGLLSERYVGPAPEAATTSAAGLERMVAAVRGLARTPS
jgi:hypothetical protein